MAAPFVPIPPDSEQILNSALAAFTDSIQAYLPLLVTWGERILGAVVFLGFGYALIQAVLNRDWFGILMDFAWAVLRIAIIYLVFANFVAWSGAFPAMGQIIGADVSGVSPSFGPSDVYALGWHIVGMLFTARHFGTWFFHPFDDILFLILIVATQITWFAAGLIYLWVFLEAKWVSAAGCVPVAFSGYEHTFPILENYFVTCLQAGIRLLAAMVVLAIGLLLAHGWIADLDTRGLGVNTDQIGYGAIQLVEAALLFYAMWSLPKKAAQIVTSKGGGGVYTHGSEGAEAMFALSAGAVSRAARAGVSKALKG